MSCINTNSIEYRRLKMASGISDVELRGFISEYQSLFHTDEFPPVEWVITGGQSTIEDLKVKIGMPDLSLENNLILGEDISKTDVINANRLSRDLKVSYDHFDDVYEVKKVATIHRPLKSLNSTQSETEYGRLMTQSIISSLDRDYGVTINLLTSKEFGEQFGVNSNGCTMDGKIFLDAEKIHDGTLMHECMHLLLSPIKNINYSLYEKFISIVEATPEAANIMKEYDFLSYNDRLEEAFCEITGRYLSGLLSSDSAAYLKRAGFDRVIYEIAHTLDKTLELDVSATTESFSVLTKSMNQIVGVYKEFDLQPFITNDRMSQVSMLKSDLMKSYLLEEIC